MAQLVAVRTNTQREQYAEWLKGYRWDYFMTSTFRHARKEPYYALQSVSGVLVRHNVARAFLVAEPHQSGDLHIHGVLAGSVTRSVPVTDGLGHTVGMSEPHNLIDTPLGIWQGLFKRFGRAKVEACNSHEAVSSYCAKYILKQQSRVCDYYEVVGNKLTWQRGKL